MKLKFSALSCILLFLNFFVQNLYAQKITANECIGMWKEKQGYHQQQIINDLFFNFQPGKASKNLNDFQSYLSNHKNDIKIQANILIYRTYYLIRVLKFEEFNEQFDTLSRQLLTTIKKVYSLKDDNLMAWLYFLYGEINLRKDNVEESLFYNLKAAEIFENLPREAFPEKSNIYHSITRALFFSREYNKAVEYGKKCEAALEKEGKMVSDTRIYNCDFMFICLLNLNQIQEAEKYVNELNKAITAFQFQSRATNEIWRGVYYNYAGQVEMRKGDNAGAMENFKKALTLVQKNNDKSNIISLKTNIGTIHLKQGEKTAAEKEWLEALNLSWNYIKENIQDRKQTITLLKLLADFYTRQQDYKTALEYVEKYNEQKDILDEQVQGASIRLANARIKNDFLNNELLLYEKNIRFEQHLRYAMVIIFLLVIFGIIHFYLSKRKRHILALEVKEQERINIQENLAHAEKNLNDFKRIITSKNNIISELSSTLMDEMPESAKSRLQKFIILTDEDWENFRMNFSKTHPLFFSVLKNHYPEITPATLRLSALIYLRLSNDEIAASLGISKESVSRSLRRLRNTFQIDKEENLPLWLETMYETNKY